jgi:hypothetical protein
MKMPALGAASVGSMGRPSLAQLRRLWRSALLLPLAVFLVSLAAALHAALKWTDGHLIYSVDDAYIHMAVAKNFASHGLWGCTPYHFSSSSSSLLWTFVLGVAYRLFGVRDVIPLIFNIALVVVTLVVTDRYLKHLAAPAVLRAAALLGLVVAFPMTGMVLLGMEHVLHFLLTIWFAAEAAEALTGRPEEQGSRHRRTLGLCVLGALLGASRYEGFFLIGLACLGFLARRQPLRAVSIGAAALLPVAVFGVISVANGGFFLPNSLMLKASGESVSALSALFKPFGAEDLKFLRNNLALPILLVIGVLSALVEWRSRRDFWRPQVLFPALLVGMIVAHGHYVFSPMYWVYRYDAYLVGFGLFVVTAVLAELRAPVVFPRGLLPACLVAALVVGVADVREGLVAAAEIAGVRNTYLEQRETALFIQAYYPRQAVIVNDLGAVTYYTEARILDLAALGDTEPLEILRRTGNYTRGDVRTWTAKYQPAIAIISLGWSWIAPLVPNDWVRVAVLEVPPNRERVGFFAVDPKDAWIIRANVAEHYSPLRQARGYQVKLRRPEKMYEVTGETAAGEPPGAVDRSDP